MSIGDRVVVWISVCVWGTILWIDDLDAVVETGDKERRLVSRDQLYWYEEHCVACHGE